jgi:outer membrane protein assembly factor BamB
VTVTVAGKTSNSENIAIDGGLVITSLSPGTALAGQTITVTGSGFGATQDSSYVLFSDAGINWGAPGDAATWSISSWSNTQITFAVPNPSGSSGLYAVVPNTTATVTVTVAGKTSNSENIAIITQPVNWYTRSFNLPRTGANLNEAILTPANVNSTQFGKLFMVNTDGEIFAQPLYVSDLTIAGAAHNAVFVATMNNSIYAIDADNGAILWTQNYGTPIVATEVESDQNIAWISGIGILSTPVIDPSTNYMYFVHGTELSGASHEYQLEAIDITTGTRVFNPTTISATYTADATSPVTFNATKQNQRTSLALANGNIYFAFGSHEDWDPYEGWVFAYSASTLAQVAVYADQTEGSKGGIWMAGSAPAIDVSGNLYLSSGNGTFGATPSGLMQTGNSFIKLSPTLQLLDYFTPSNSATLNANDMDLGSGGVLLVPSPSNPQGESMYVAGGGKEGILYLANPNNLGKFNASQDQVVQEFQAIYGTGTSHIHGTPIYFDSAVNGPSLYIWGENDYLRGFQFNATEGLLTAAPFAESTMTAPVTNADAAMPGGFLSISANGGTNGIVWASTPYSGNALTNIVQGVVYAFNANTLQELWSDKDNDSRDEIGLFAKYCPPVVVNGKLYMATFGPLATGTTAASGQLVVYGLLPQQ